MSGKATPMTAKDMEAARLLLDGKKSPEIARILGMNARVLRRHMVRSDFLAYQEKVREENNKALGAKTRAQLKTIEFTLADRVAICAEIANDKKKRSRDRLLACKVAHDMLRGNPADPMDDHSEKPDVYRAAWMGQPN